VTPGGPDTGAHWDSVYTARPPETMSWFQARPATSLRLLEAFLPGRGSVLDVGAGRSLLAETLLDSGWPDVTVLDVSTQALDALTARLDRHREALTVVAADLLSWQPVRTWDAWHDRAVFHFLTDPTDRAHYRAVASAAVAPGGVLVIGTFAADGPTRCSGLPTVRYDPATLAAQFEPAFALEHSETEHHVTPAGAAQPFTWAVLRRAPSPGDHGDTQRG
jgi:SAM-dependent methyltransferase